MIDLNWIDVRRKIDKTNQEAEKLLADKIYYIKERGERGEYTYKGINAAGIILDPNLPEQVKEYHIACGRLEVQKSKLKDLKDDITYLDSPTKLAMVKKKWNAELEELFARVIKNEALKPPKKYDNALEAQCAKIIHAQKKPIEYKALIEKLDQIFLLQFIQEKYMRVEKEFQGSKLEFIDKEKVLEKWIKDGKPGPKSLEQIKASMRDDSFEDDSDISIEDTNRTTQSVVNSNKEKISRDTMDNSEEDWDVENTDENNSKNVKEKVSRDDVGEGEEDWDMANTGNDLTKLDIPGVEHSKTENMKAFTPLRDKHKNEEQQRVENSPPQPTSPFIRPK